MQIEQKWLMGVKQLPLAFRVALIVVFFIIAAIPLYIYAETVALTTSSVFTEFNGESDGDFFGSQVAFGDINGDGYDDVLFGSQGADDGGDNAGAVYLYYGGVGADLLKDTINASTADATFIGEAADDHAGVHVDTCDIDGDGFDDILIGADDHDDGGTDAGAAYIMYGATGAAPHSGDIDLSTADAKIVGETGDVGDCSGAGNCGDHIGDPVSCVGDVNNDGFEDIGLNAWGDDDGGQDAGAIYLLYGDDDGDLDDDASLDNVSDIPISDAHAKFTGESAFDYAGYHISYVNADGDDYDDMLFGVSFDDDGGANAGAAYIVYGQASDFSGSLALSTNADAKFVGEDGTDFAGDFVGGIGDIDNDGFEDILIGATREATTGADAGAYYVFLGDSTDFSGSVDTSTADIKFVGEIAGDFAGEDGAGGDIDNDGFSDIIMGANHETNGGPGAAYVVLGSSTGTLPSGTNNLSTADYIYTGESDGDFAGFFLASGDLNNDSYADLLISGQANEAGGTNRGAAYLGYVIDELDPVITITGDNPATHECTSSYSDAGATAIDNVDGVVTSDIVTDASDVNEDAVGSYSVDYSVTDAQSNEGTNTRTVNVTDTGLPVITRTGAASVDQEAGESYVDLGATATDGCTGTITDDIVVTNPVDTDALGEYTVRYNVSDASGNDATEVTRTVTVEDTTAPVITLNGSAEVDVELGASYVDSGATASDSFEGTLTDDIVVVNPVDTDVIGEYTVTYNVSDSSGNAAVEVTRTVNVALGPLTPALDDNLPDIELSEDASTEAFDLDDYFSDGNGDALTYAVSTSDSPADITVDIATDGSVTVTPDADWNGSDTVTFTATDPGGLSVSSNQVTITVAAVNDAPNRPTSGFSPAKKARTSDRTPTISWDAVTDIDDDADDIHYVLRIGTGSSPSDSYEKQYTTDDGDTSVLIDFELPLDTTIYYVVRSVDDDGEQSNWSAVQQFSTTSDAPVLELSKSVGINIAQLNQTPAQRALAWMTARTASADSFTATVFSDRLIIIALIQLCIAVLIALFVYWRIRLHSMHSTVSFFFRAPQDSFHEISESKHTGTYMDSYTDHKRRVQASQSAGSVSSIGLIVLLALAINVTPGLTSFDDQSGQPVEPGDVLTYQIAYSNTGEGDATDVSLADTIPTGAAYVDGSAVINGSLASATLDGRSLTIDGSNWSAGASGTIQYKAVIDNPMAIAIDSISAAGAVVSTNELDDITTNTVTNPLTQSSIAGLVLDASTSGAIAGAVVSLVDEGGSTISAAVTNAVGYYQITGLRSGVYTVQVTGAPGYVTPGVVGVSIDAGEDELQNVFLSSAASGGDDSEEPIPSDEVIDSIEEGEVDPNDLPENDIEVILDDIRNGDLDADDLKSIDESLFDRISDEIIRQVVQGEDITAEEEAIVVERLTDDLGLIDGNTNITFQSDTVDLALEGRALPGSDVLITLCSADGQTRQFRTTAGDDGTWNIAIPREEVESEGFSLFAESTLNGIQSHVKKLGYAIEDSQRFNTTFWIVMGNIIVLTIIGMIGVAVARRQRSAEVRPMNAIEMAVFSVLALALIGALVWSFLPQDPSNEFEFTVRLDIPELQIDSVNGQGVSLDQTVTVGGEETVKLRGTGEPNTTIALQLCSGFSEYVFDIDAAGNWELEIPLSEIPDQQIVYSAAIGDTEASGGLFEITEYTPGDAIPQWMILVLSVVLGGVLTRLSWAIAASMGGVDNGPSSPSPTVSTSATGTTGTPWDFLPDDTPARSTDSGDSSETASGSSDEPPTSSGGALSV